MDYNREEFLKMWERLGKLNSEQNIIRDFINDKSIINKSKSVEENKQFIKCYKKLPKCLKRIYKYIHLTS